MNWQPHLLLSVHTALQQGVKVTVSEEERRELKEAFDFNDSDSNGQIDFMEFMSLLEGLEAGIDAAQAQFGFETVDTDGDGAISFDEFVEWWRET